MTGQILRLTGEGAPVELWLMRLAAARGAQRQAAREWLAAELQRREPSLPAWVETSKGPARPPGARWNSSFSYCGPYILCGLSQSGMPGVDLTTADTWEGADDVARLYGGPEAAKMVAGSPPSCRADIFAQMWGALEARLKACRRGLEEYSPQRDLHLAAAGLTCQVRHGRLWASSALCPDRGNAQQGA
ncbi:hypothetical protein RAS12_13855 [Achromobacter seleniivolatilans]|uniref:4'-phosphopantetheinyl transferase domain-containing protein n=1 Tax=Achromobacter seleniivolatilans TaxID=3047478 RepID=A0ABY9M9R1_9BURK|nr:hypothetical protein [Achromobacter sp. R39]WMD23724.1 hypothetical protein RAS12_13855 [Achromobacter sp. R39]